MNSIAIIPARSGSKGLRDKNIKELAGKPLISYTIAAAVESRLFDEIMVSTDSWKYAEIAKKYGAKVPFLRSRENSSDAASSWDTVKEVLDNYSKDGRIFDSFCLLQPTSPLRDSEDIRNAYKIFCEKADVAVVSVCEAEHSPLWCGQLDEEGNLDSFIKKENNIRRQAQKKFYRLNGAIYFVKIKEFEKDINLYRKGSYAYIMDSYKSIDIDGKQDFDYAEFLLQKNILFEFKRGI